MARTDERGPAMPRADVCVFSVPFWNPSYEEFKTWWDWALDNAPRAQLLELANPNTLNIAWRDARFMDVLRRADCTVNDGVGIRVASRMRGVRTRYNFAGTDLMPRLFTEAHRDVRVFFFGATEESNRLAAEKVTARHPRVVCAGRVNGYVDPVREALPMIRDSGADILMCALGQPKQEYFMSENIERLNVRVAVTCGGMFDFFSETKRRAPQFMRRTGTEWVYRLAIEPKRMFNRYVVGNPLFLWRAMCTVRSDVKCAAGSSEAQRSSEAQN